MIKGHGSPPDRGTFLDPQVREMRVPVPSCRVHIFLFSCVGQFTASSPENGVGGCPQCLSVVGPGGSRIPPPGSGSGLAPLVTHTRVILAPRHDPRRHRPGIQEALAADGGARREGQRCFGEPQGCDMISHSQERECGAALHRPLGCYQSGL